jgi:hypothetical protein
MDKGKLVVHIGVEGWRVLAARTGDYAGQAGPQWCGPDGAWRDVWLDEKNPPAAARVGVRRKGDLEPTWAVATYKEFGRPNLPIWKEKPSHMLAVAAERHALRKACPGAEAEAMAVVQQYAPTATVVDEEPPADLIPEASDVSLTGPDVVEAEGGEGVHHAPSPNPPLPESHQSGDFIAWWEQVSEAQMAAGLSTSDMARLTKPKPWNGEQALAYCRAHGLDAKGLVAAAQRAGEAS